MVLPAGAELHVIDCITRYQKCNQRAFLYEDQTTPRLPFVLFAFTLKGRDPRDNLLEGLSQSNRIVANYP